MINLVVMAVTVTANLIISENTDSGVQFEEMKREANANLTLKLSAQVSKKRFREKEKIRIIVERVKLLNLLWNFLRIQILNRITS